MRSSTPEAQGMDSDVLTQAFDYVRQYQIPIHSLLIVRNGYVVLDASASQRPPHQNARRVHAQETESATGREEGMNHNPDFFRIPERCSLSVEPVLAQRALRGDRKRATLLSGNVLLTQSAACPMFQTGLVRASSGESTCAPNDSDLQSPRGNSH